MNLFKELRIFKKPSSGHTKLNLIQKLYQNELTFDKIGRQIVESVYYLHVLSGY